MKKCDTSLMVLIAIIIISLLGGLFAILNTRIGPWGYSDPVVYISTARSLASGQGFGYFEADAEFAYLTIQPPFYSIVLSIFALLKVNLVAGARWLNISAFTLSIFISGWIFIKFSKIRILGVLASILMCVFPHFIVMSISAYSEPLFILLFLSGGWCMLHYLRKNNPWSFLGSALLIGLTPVTRYVGLALIIAGGLSIWLLSSGKQWIRVKKSLLYLFISGLPILIWFIWVYFSDAHTIGGRNLDINWSTLALEFKNFRGLFLDTVWKWFPFQSPETLLRYRTRYILSGIILILLVVLCFLAERRIKKVMGNESQRNDFHIITFFGLSAGLLLTIIIATYLLTFPKIDIDNRTLLPLYVCGVMCLFGIMALWQTAWFVGRFRILQVLPWILTVLCVIWYLPQVKERMDFYQTNTGFTALDWNNSLTVQAVRDLPSDQAVISNEWELLLLWTGRPIHGYWNTFPVKPPLQTDSYGTDPRDSVQFMFCNQDAALVIFNSFQAQYKDEVDPELFTVIPSIFDGLIVYGSYPDATIYLCP